MTQEEFEAWHNVQATLSWAAQAYELLATLKDNVAADRLVSSVPFVVREEVMELARVGKILEKHARK